MSKAFTKDDDGAEAPLVIPRRASLPAGMPNYVTSRGLALLQAELATERDHAQRSPGHTDAERARDGAVHSARVADIEHRLASAVLVDSHRQPRDEVRFGATVNVHNTAGVERRYRIVGLDEADAAVGAIAFVAPLARALLGKRVGDVATVKTPVGEDNLEIVAIHYD